MQGYQVFMGAGVYLAHVTLNPKPVNAKERHWTLSYSPVNAFLTQSYIFPGFSVKLCVCNGVV